MGKMVFCLFSAVLVQILFILAGNDDMHNNLHEFKIQLVQTIN